MRAQPESFGRRFSCDALPDHFVLSQQYTGDDCGSFVHSMIVGPVGLLCPGWFDSYPAVDHRRRDSAEADQRSSCLNLTWPISQAEIARAQEANRPNNHRMYKRNAIVSSILLTQHKVIRKGIA